MDPSSTTISSRPHEFWSSTLSIAWRRLAEPLNTGIIAETLIMPRQSLIDRADRAR